jgi:LysR family cyn operon transcriptional activator
VELRHLKYFMRAAELSHFTRAAESLYISQPSLSVHIQQLEEELKTKLFSRVGRNVRLTEAGQILFKHAQRAVGELDAAGQEIDAITGLLQGTLTIGTVSLFGSKILPGWIDRFSTQHPDVHVFVRVARAEDIENGLVSGTFDIGFSLLPSEHTEISSTELFADQTVMIVSKEHPLAQKKKLEVADFATVNMALPSHKIISSSRSLGGFFESAGIVPKVMVEQDDGHALLELVKHGNFVTFLPRFIVKDETDLHLLPLPGKGITVSFGVLWTDLNAASSVFLETVKQAAAAT